LLDVGGQDATEAFEDVGHSDEAREILDGLLVGTLKRMVIFPHLDQKMNQRTDIDYTARRPNTQGQSNFYFHFKQFF